MSSMTSDRYQHVCHTEKKRNRSAAAVATDLQVEEKQAAAVATDLQVEEKQAGPSGTSEPPCLKRRFTRARVRACVRVC